MTLEAASREALRASARANGGAAAVSRHPRERSASRGSGQAEGVHRVTGTRVRLNWQRSSGSALDRKRRPRPIPLAKNATVPYDGVVVTAEDQSRWQAVGVSVVDAFSTYASQAPSVQIELFSDPSPVRCGVRSDVSMGETVGLAMVA